MVEISLSQYYNRALYNIENMLSPKLFSLLSNASLDGFDTNRVYNEFSNGYTLLGEVLENWPNDRTKELRVVVDHASDLNTVCVPKGDSPIHLLTASKNVSILEYLINNSKIEVGTQRPQDGFTSLHIVAQNQYKPGIADLLLKKRPTMINSKDKEGNTPLHIAAKIGNVYMIKYLLGKGADSKQLNGDNKTAKELAKDKDCQRIFATLEDISSKRTSKEDPSNVRSFSF